MTKETTNHFYRWLIEANIRLCKEFGGEHKLINDAALLHAVIVPWANYFELELYPTDSDKLNAFAKQFGHPFLDGNKRTMFAGIEYLCNLLGWRWDVPLETKYQYVMQVAGAKIEEEISILESNLVLTPYIFDIDEIIEENKTVMECLSNPRVTAFEE